MIQQYDLKKEYAILEDEIQNELKNVFSKTNFIGGENVISIENNIAKYIGAKYAVSCNSGTDALHFSLKSFDIFDFVFFARKTEGQRLTLCTDP